MVVQRVVVEQQMRCADVLVTVVVAIGCVVGVLVYQRQPIRQSQTSRVGYVTSRRVVEQQQQQEQCVQQLVVHVPALTVQSQQSGLVAVVVHATGVHSHQCCQQATSVAIVEAQSVAADFGWDPACAAGSYTNQVAVLLSSVAASRTAEVVVAALRSDVERDVGLVAGLLLVVAG